MVDTSIIALVASTAIIVGYVTLRWLDRRAHTKREHEPESASEKAKDEVVSRDGVDDTLSVPFKRVTERLYMMPEGSTFDVTHDVVEAHDATAWEGERIPQHVVHKAFGTPRRVENAGVVTERYYTVTGGTYGYGPGAGINGKKPYAVTEPTEHAVVLANVLRRKTLESHDGEVHVPIRRVTREYSSGKTDEKVYGHQLNDAEIEIHD